MDLKINKFNYSNLFPNSPLKFETLVVKPGSPMRTMKIRNSYNTTRFLYINDIIHIFERGIKDNNSPNRNHTKAWKIFLENDIQEYLDNIHERDTNSN